MDSWIYQIDVMQQMIYINGIEQDWTIFVVKALEISQSYTKPLTWCVFLSWVL